jgi:hypothetical protein
LLVFLRVVHHLLLLLLLLEVRGCTLEWLLELLVGLGLGVMVL